MKRDLIIIGLGMNAIVFVIGLILALSSHRLRRADEPKPTPIFKAFNQQRAKPEPLTSPTNGQTFAPDQTVTICYDLSGPKEAELIQTMTATLADLGQVWPERTVKQVVLARIEGDWSTTPPGPEWKDNPQWQKICADRLKHKIGWLLGTTNLAYAVLSENTDNQIPHVEIMPADPLTIKRVLETPVGETTVPPMEDFVVPVSP